MIPPPGFSTKGDTRDVDYKNPYMVLSRPRVSGLQNFRPPYLIEVFHNLLQTTVSSLITKIILESLCLCMLLTLSSHATMIR